MLVHFTRLSVLLIFANLAFAAAPASPGMRTLAGTGEKGFAGDDGPAVKAKLADPSGLVIGPNKSVYFCDTANHAVRRIAPDGTITTVAATGGKSGYTGDGGPATQATLNEPYEVRFDKAGSLFVVERLNHCVRRVDGKTGVITTVAGTGKPGFSGDNGAATKAQLREPHSIQFGPDGALYIADVLNHRIRRVDLTTGVITTFAGTGEKKSPTDGAKLDGAPLHGPRALDFGPDGDLYVALREGNSIWRIDMKTRTLRRVAGTGKKGFAGNDGPALKATLNGPKGISVAPNGDVYIADTESHSIRYVDHGAGKIHVLAGTGEKGDGANGPASECKLNRPHGVFVAADGTVLIGDSGNNRVRVVKTAS
jgi:streptogramin lyase